MATSEAEIIDSDMQQLEKQTDASMRSALATRNEAGMMGLAVLDFAKLAVTSGMFPEARSLSQAAMTIAIGRDMGFTASQSLRCVYVRGQGEGDKRRVSIGIKAEMMAAKIRESGRYDYEVIESTTTKATLRFLRKRDRAWKVLGPDVSFTMEEAKKAGLVRQGSAWENYAEDMLLWRAMARGQRRYCPDVFGGHSVYTEDELRELGATERTVATVEPEAKPAPAIAPEVVAAFDALRWNQAARSMWLGQHGALPVEKQVLLLASEKVPSGPVPTPQAAPAAPVETEPPPASEPAATGPVPTQTDLADF